MLTSQNTQYSLNNEVKMCFGQLHDLHEEYKIYQRPSLETIHTYHPTRDPSFDLYLFNQKKIGRFPLPDDNWQKISTNL